jgi:hypothetical protein
LTAVVPLGFERARDGGSGTGIGNIQLAAKLRFLHQRDAGWDVALFPRLFVPSGSPAVGSRRTALQLPLWLGRDWNRWSTFGGGGCQYGHQGAASDFCFGGWALARQVGPALQLGAELFHQTRAAGEAGDKTVVGAGLHYDCSERAHLLAYASAGVHNAAAEHRYSWYLALLFTF